jgi:DNA-directed RNA polymerase specialized sigma24 family protein
MKHQTTTAPSSDSPYGLTNEQRYRTEIAQCARLTKAQEQRLVDRARTGDPQVGEDLIMSLLSGVECIASRYYTGYAKLWKRLEYLDLIQESIRAIVEKLTVALEKANPCAYLLATAEGAIHRYCFQQRRSIGTPETDGVAPLLVESLDTPRFSDDDLALLDGVAALPTSTGTTKEDSIVLYQAIHQAVDTLPTMQRTVVTRLYGLPDTPAEELVDLQRVLDGNKRYKTASVHKRLALTALRRKLAPPFFVSDEGGAA